MLESGRVFALVTLIAVVAAMVRSIYLIKKGQSVCVRDIPGLRALEEFIGRATEMGRPVHFSSGVGTLTGASAPEMFCGLQVLSYMAHLTAKYDTRLIATACQPDVFLATVETVRQSYMEEGKTESFRINDVRYLSTDQWAYAAGIVGIVSREKVAANVLIGAFAAETMLLAEASHQAGAAQIAGTTNMYQLPFFVASCDYTLIGEEMFAAGAFLSNDPVQLGSLRGQDFGKAMAVVLIIVGAISITFGSHWLDNILHL